MPRPRKYDWDMLRIAYVEAGKELAELAADHGVPHDKVRRRSSAEDWPQQRRLYRQRIEQARQAQKVDSVAGQAAEFDSLAFRTAHSATALVARRVAELGRIVREMELVKGTEGAPKGHSLDEVSPVTMELERLAKAAATWHKVGHEALGDVPKQEVTVRDVATAAKGEARTLGDDALAVIDGALSAVEAGSAGTNGDGTHR